MFRLIKKKPYTVTRKTLPSYNDIGVLIPDSETETAVPLEGIVQPASWDEIIQEVQGDKTRDLVKLFTTTLVRNMRAGDSGWLADTFVYNGDVYEVLKVKVWTTGHDQDHYVAWAARATIAPVGGE